jgi:hypothetical protein
MKNFQNRTNIVRVSKIIRNLMFAGFFLWIFAIPATLITVFLTLCNWAAVTPESRYYHCYLPLLQVLCLIVNLKLFRFFDRLKNGNLFDADTVKNLDDAGRWWVAFWLFQVLFHAIGTEFFQMTKMPGLGFGEPDLGGSLFAGLALIFVAWLLKEAEELQQEQELTV